MEILTPTSTSTYLFWTWYANYTSYFGDLRLRYTYSVRIEGCLVAAYYRGQFQPSVNLSSYFFWSVNFTSWVCKS